MNYKNNAMFGNINVAMGQIITSFDRDCLWKQKVKVFFWEINGLVRIFPPLNYEEIHSESRNEISADTSDLREYEGSFR